MITEHNGDIFLDIRKPTVIMHGCNMQGVMGAGIARMVKNLFPAMYYEYHNICKENKATLGGVYLRHANNNIYIANAFTQFKFGDANLEAIRKSIQYVSSAFGEDVELRSVRVGCGLGGLDWKYVKPLYENDKGHWNIYEIL